LTRRSELLPTNRLSWARWRWFWMACGKKEEAGRAYRATLRLDPDNAIAMNNLASCWPNGTRIWTRPWTWRGGPVSWRRKMPT